MAERGLSIDHSTIHRWVIHFAPLLLKQLNLRKRPLPGSGISTSYIRVRGANTRHFASSRISDPLGPNVASSFCATKVEKHTFAWTRRPPESHPGNRWFGCGCHRRRFRNGWRTADRIDSNRLGDILHPLFAQEFKLGIELVPDVIVGGARDNDAARIGETLQAAGDVDPVAVDITALDNDITEIDAHTDVNSFSRCHPVIALRHLPLDYNRAFHRIDDARKLGQESVAHEFEHSTVVPLDFRLEEFGPMRLEPRKRSLLVALHKCRVADRIGGKNGRKLAFHGKIQMIVKALAKSAPDTSR